jgi:heterotetrameric sarcosine oxidase gamma subunit
VAVAYASAEREAQTCRAAAGWADTSHLGKLELQATPPDLQAIAGEVMRGEPLALGVAARADGAWWCPLTEERVLVICDPSRVAALRGRLELATAAGEGAADVVDVSTAFAGLTIAGPLAREVIARFCAIDLRPRVTPVASVRPGSIARQPGIVVCEAEARFLLLFGWALGEYVWRQVEDAGRRLGAAPVGIDALPPLDRVAEEARSGA